MRLPRFPIDDVLAEIKSVLASSSAVLSAPPGSGKTTIVPLALLDEPWLVEKKILILEPRRLAARTAAFRMSSLLSEEIGRTVGYQIRFDRQCSDHTRIEVITEGILTRRIQQDPDLTGIGLIIFDEYHERSIHADLALALCLDLCQINADLRLLVMSATLDTAPIAALLGNVPVITGDGKIHKVEIEYLDQEPQERIVNLTAMAVRRVLKERDGDLLVFLPGVGEIKATHALLASDGEKKEAFYIPLYGDLSPKEQNRAIQPDPQGRRRVILATSIAETSLTIEGISCVVDSGWSRRPLFDTRSGLTTLTTLRVSKAVATQRAGRAGRLGPGYCLRLWTRHQDHGLVPFHPPEIKTVDLVPLALELALWGVAPDQLSWLDPPPPGPYLAAKELLVSLGAIDSAGQITESGRKIAQLPIHPRLGHMLLMAKPLNQTQLACDLAAILTEKDILKRDGRQQPTAELELRFELLQLWRSQGPAALKKNNGLPEICARVERLSRQWSRLIQANDSPTDHEQFGNLLVYAYPDRIAQRRKDQSENYLLSSGRGARLHPGDPLVAHEYLVLPQLDAGSREGRIFLAETISPDDLKTHHSKLLTTKKQIYWDGDRQRVCATIKEHIGEIVLSESPWSDAEQEQITDIMQSGIEQMGIESLPWTNEARQLQARLCSLHAWQPAANWPDLRDELLIKNLDWLRPYLGGITSRQQLQKVNLAAVFLSFLDWDQQTMLEKLAPARMTVPSGSKIKIQYHVNDPPIIAVRVQEMFGLNATPAICNGQVPLVLHLLSPAQRPIQITSDLQGFWQGSYQEVKKQLKGRYPKHFWPDNPEEAQATRKTKKSA